MSVFHKQKKPIKLLEATINSEEEDTDGKDYSLLDIEPNPEVSKPSFKLLENILPPPENKKKKVIKINCTHEYGVSSKEVEEIEQ